MFVNNFKLFTRRNSALLLALIALAALAIPMANSRIKPYYSGEAISYKQGVFIGTTNSGKFELFGLNDGSIYKKTSIVSLDNKDFSDLFFRQEGSRLFVYLVDDALYKYDISDPYFPVLAAKVKDNSGDKFFGVLSAGERIATLGNKGIKIWNDRLQVINSYRVQADNPENVIFSRGGGYIYNYSGDSLQIIDTNSRKLVLERKMDIKAQSHHQKIYNDGSDGSVYAVDDNALYKIYFDGEEKSFEHISDVGYDVASPRGSSAVYFSDGHGVVKVSKNNLDILSWAYTTDKGAVDGWAMGIDAVPSADGDILVVFNGSSILALDEGMRLLDHYAAREQDNGPLEPLSLSADKHRAAPGSYVSLRGAGYLPHEKIKIYFAGDLFEAKADELGRFNRVIRVPSVLPVRTDIRTFGLMSDFSYSLAFDIE